MKSLVVVNNSKDWIFPLHGIEVISARAYLTEPHYATLSKCRIYNLCRNYKYQSMGYYVSLLAEARGHKAVPDVTTIQDLKSQAIVKVLSTDVDELIQKKLKHLKGDEFDLSIYFGRNLSVQYEDLARKLFNLFPSPILKFHFSKTKKWNIQKVVTLSLTDVPENHRDYFFDSAKEYFSKKRWSQRKAPQGYYDLAILVNKDEKNPPSDAKAIKKFIEAGEELGIQSEIISPDDFGRISEFDALFIRETTSVHHHTYRFSRKAFADGLVVIDDPLSILRCANKVYLTEILVQAKIPIPKTVIVHNGNRENIEKSLEYPCVLKKPDGAFSKAVVKVENREALNEKLDEMFASSELLLAQSFTPTDFDWRIGVLDQRVLFACKYFMARGHWQIYNWQDTKNSTGPWECVPLSKVPGKVLKTALKAANLIGNGFYGVDLKEYQDQVYVIEVNDNPSIETEVEDAILGDHLYFSVMQSFLTRLSRLKKFSYGGGMD